jgi:hypothetical protein
MSPGVALIPVPGMQKLTPHTSGDLLRMQLGFRTMASERRDRVENCDYRRDSVRYLVTFNVATSRITTLLDLSSRSNCRLFVYLGLRCACYWRAEL